MPRPAKTARLLDELRQELPRLLREDLEVRGQVIAVLSEYLTTREETAAILAELRQMREDFDRRMDEQGRRIEEHTRTLGAIGARWGMMTEAPLRVVATQPASAHDTAAMDGPSVERGESR